MKVPQILAIIGLFSSNILAAPSQFTLKDPNSVTTAGKDISSGRYFISNPNGLAIGRSLREDRSLLPKRVISENKDTDPWATLWDVQKLDNGNYILRIGGSPTAEIDGNLYAVLLDQPRPTEWKIEYQPQHAAYTISKANDYKGWVVGQEEQSQVLVRYLIVGPSVPPFFPPNERFIFEPANSDDSYSIDNTFHENLSHEKQEVHVDVTISIE